MLPLLAPPLVDKRAELGAEDIGKAEAWSNWQAMQQHSRRAVGGQDGTIGIDRQQAGAERMQVFAAVVKRDEQLAAVAFAEQAVFNLRRGHGDKRLGLARQAI